MSGAPGREAGATGRQRPAIRPGTRNMRRLSHHRLGGFGCGEGLAIQRTRDGRRVLWIAHESPPKNVTAVDVTDPRAPALYVGYLDGGAFILDIADLARPREVARWDYPPPFPGFCHTVLPLFGRGLLVVSDESIVDGAADWPKLVWIVDVREETKPKRLPPARGGVGGAGRGHAAQRRARRRARGGLRRGPGGGGPLRLRALALMAGWHGEGPLLPGLP